MAGTNFHARLAWEDRFAVPTYEQLRDASSKPVAVLIDAARQRLLAIPGALEELTWQGIPWRWSMVYRLEDAPERAGVYLVPRPDHPRLVIPLRMDVLTRMPVKKLPRYVREGILAAPAVNGVHWAQWEFTVRSQLDDVLATLELRLSLQAAQA